MADEYAPQPGGIIPMGAPSQQPGGIIPLANARQPGGIVPITNAGPVVPLPAPGTAPLSMGQTVAGVGEMVGTVGTSLYAEPLAGIAGFATSLINPEAAPYVIERVRENFQYLPKTEGGQRMGRFLADTVGKALGYLEQGAADYALEATGSPAAAAAATTLPTAITELLGVAALKNARHAVSSAKHAKLKDLQNRQISSRNLHDELLNETNALMSPKNKDNAIETVRTLNPNEIAQMIDADPNFFRAADELGINTEPVAAFVTRNSQTRDVLGTLQAMPGSQLDARARDFIADTNERAGNIIAKYNGTLDKAQLSSDFYNQSMKAIDDIYLQEGVLYDDIAANIPRNTPAMPTRIEGVLNQIMVDMGGRIEDLPTSLGGGTKNLRGLYGQISGRMENGKYIPPTYYKLDQIRKDIGRAIKKQEGPFKDEEVGLLKRLYGALRDDIDAVADAHGYGAQLKEANILTQQRKIIEDSLETLLTKNLNRDISTVMGQAVKGIKGQTMRFKEIVQALDEINRVDMQINGGRNNIMRREQIVLSAMNDAMRGSGVEQGLFSANKFAGFMNELNQQPALKNLLYKNLPEGAPKAFDNLYVIADGIQKANQFLIKNGRTMTALDETGLLMSLMGRLGQQAAGLLPMGGDLLREFLSQKNKVSRTANEMLASPEFQIMLRDTVMEGSRQGTFAGTRASKKLAAAEKALLKSKQFEQWYQALKNTGGISDEVLMLIGTAPATYFAGQPRPLTNDDRKMPQQAMQRPITQQPPVMPIRR